MINRLNPLFSYFTKLHREDTELHKDISIFSQWFSVYF